jgi:hypothetical protein
MGFFTNILSATVKIATGEEPDSTKNLLSSAQEDVVDAFDDLGDGEI